MLRLGLVVPFVLTVLAVVAPARPGGAADAAKEPSLKEALVANEKGAFEAFKQKNASTFNDYLADDFLGVDAGGVTRKAAQSEAMADTQLKDYALDDIKLVKATKNVGILTYKLTQHGTYKGDPIPATVHATSVWVKRGDKWLAVLHQETPARPTRSP
ncbi:MAG: nuclear transport factor 2 family protein [Deltaproteobacteria bacterium]|nr:MAG: nuclear transport factor 2 family protein [Deltaproteobacteria bacterium]